MTKIVSVANGVKTEHEIENKSGFTVIVHPQGVKVDVPTFVEINPRNTIECMSKMNQQEWEWISNGELFQTLFNESFAEKNNIQIPQTIDEINDGDMGVTHVVGMIAKGCEAMFEGRSIFVRNPETYLHPETERRIMGMFEKMLNLCGRSGVVTDEMPEGQEQETAQPEPDPERDKELTLQWLHAMDPAKEFAQVAGEVYTVADLILEVTNDSGVGHLMVQKFVNLRDGN